MKFHQMNFPQIKYFVKKIKFGSPNEVSSNEVRQMKFHQTKFRQIKYFAKKKFKNVN